MEPQGKKLRIQLPENISSSSVTTLNPTENFKDSFSNLSVNRSNLQNYLYYINKWADEIRNNTISDENLKKYIDISFPFVRDLNKNNSLRDINMIQNMETINNIKETNKLLTPEQRSRVNQAKLREMDINFASGNFRGGKTRRTNKKRSNKRNYKKIKKTYKKRKVNRRMK
jgi:hypothetical protein